MNNSSAILTAYAVFITVQSMSLYLTTKNRSKQLVKAGSKPLGLSSYVVIFTSLIGRLLATYAISLMLSHVHLASNSLTIILFSIISYVLIAFVGALAMFITIKIAEKIAKRYYYKEIMKNRNKKVDEYNATHGK
jgi:hypothetical protein